MELVLNLENIAARFWPKVEVRGEEECWEWQASLSGGYGQLLVGKRPQWRPMRAHRVSWVLAGLELPPRGGFVLHRCGNKRCVNPGHLYEGARLRKVRETQRRRRWRWPFKLTEAQAAEMRRRRLAGEAGAALAQEYGVSQAMVSLVKHGKRRTHVKEGEDSE